MMHRGSSKRLESPFKVGHHLEEAVLTLAGFCRKGSVPLLETLDRSGSMFETVSISAKG